MFDFECNSNGEHKPYAYGGAMMYGDEPVGYKAVTDREKKPFRSKCLYLFLRNMLAERLLSDYQLYRKLDKEAETSPPVECWLCGGPPEARDHYHRTNKFLGWACKPCNLKRRENLRIVFFHHNGTRYDNQFLGRMFSKEYDS